MPGEDVDEPVPSRLRMRAIPRVNEGHFQGKEELWVQPGGSQGQAANVWSNWTVPTKKQTQLTLTVARWDSGLSQVPNPVWEFLEKPDVQISL